MTEKAKKILSWSDRLTVNLKGGVWVGLFTLVILVGCIDVLFIHRTGDIPEGIRWIYGIVLGTFGATKGLGKFMNGKNGHTVDEND